MKAKALQIAVIPILILALLITSLLVETVQPPVVLTRALKSVVSNMLWENHALDHEKVAQSAAAIVVAASLDEKLTSGESSGSAHNGDLEWNITLSHKFCGVLFYFTDYKHDGNIYDDGFQRGESCSPQDIINILGNVVKAALGGGMSIEAIKEALQEAGPQIANGIALAPEKAQLFITEVNNLVK